MANTNHERGTSIGRGRPRKQQSSSTISPPSSTIPPPSSIIPPFTIPMAPDLTPPPSMLGVYSPPSAGSPSGVMYSPSFHLGSSIHPAAPLIHRRPSPIHLGSPSVHSGSSAVHSASPPIHPTDLEASYSQDAVDTQTSDGRPCYTLMEMYK
uniref:Pollen-specific leucine-rich repeat extensin-like protein 1 n=1 Tax=Elaeis guineensis var. tenera TaxID=51953 RepID=A0A6I9QJ68_ELAGV|nr:pollen-specific leucine-rich repeat extensin-like protein 1 [Elaeis guineensis]